MGHFAIIFLMFLHKERQTESLSYPPRINDELLTKIQNIYNELTQKDKDFPFPYDKCMPTSQRLSGEFGLRFVSGRFRVDHLPRRIRKIPHFWVEDADGTIVDLTASQFNIWLNEPIPAGMLVVTSRDPLYRRYKRDK